MLCTGGEFGVAYPLHSALDDWDADAYKVVVSEVGGLGGGEVPRARVRAVSKGMVMGWWDGVLKRFGEGEDGESVPLKTGCLMDLGRVMRTRWCVSHNHLSPF